MGRQESANIVKSLIASAKYNDVSSSAEIQHLRADARWFLPIMARIDNGWRPTGECLIYQCAGK